jgi:hypothetical protein
MMKSKKWTFWSKKFWGFRFSILRNIGSATSSAKTFFTQNSPKPTSSVKTRLKWAYDCIRKKSLTWFRAYVSTFIDGWTTVIKQTGLMDPNWADGSKCTNVYHRLPTCQWNSTSNENLINFPENIAHFKEFKLQLIWGDNTKLEWTQLRHPLLEYEPMKVKDIFFKKGKDWGISRRILMKDHFNGLFNWPEHPKALLSDHDGWFQIGVSGKSKGAVSRLKGWKDPFRNKYFVPLNETVVLQLQTQSVGKTTCMINIH